MLPSAVWMWLSATAAGLSPSARTSARWTIAIVTGSSGWNAPFASAGSQPFATATATYGYQGDVGSTSLSDDRWVGKLVRRERLDDRPREVLPRLDHIGLERVGAVGVRLEVEHPRVRGRDVLDRRLRPRVGGGQVGERHGLRALDLGSRARRDHDGDLRRTGVGVTGADAGVRDLGRRERASLGRRVSERQEGRRHGERDHHRTRSTTNEPDPRRHTSVVGAGLQNLEPAGRWYGAARRPSFREPFG